MPGNVLTAAAVGVLPQASYEAFQRVREWPVNINQYANGEVQTGVLAGSARSKWNLTQRAGNMISIPVSGATFASPIVITAGVAAGRHGLANGQTVTISGVGGNTAANTFAFTKTASPFTPTTCGLYSNAALSTPIAGNGVYTGGGIVTYSPAEALRLFYLAHNGPHQAFYFYDPEDGFPVGSNYDPTGVSTTGRYIVRFGGAFAADFGLGRSTIPFQLVEVV